MKKSKPLYREFDIKTLKSFLSTAGLSSSDAAAVASIFMRWLHCNGASWTNSRIKELRQWYENYLAETSFKPKWFRRTKSGIPKGPLGSIFRLPMEGGLLALSVNTLLFEDKRELSEKTLTKERHALEGNGFDYFPLIRENVRSAFQRVAWKNPRSDWQPELRLPVEEDIRMGKTTPVKDCKESIRVTTKSEQAQAYKEAWESVPQETVEFLIDQGHLDWIPIQVVGNQYAIQLDSRQYGKAVGKIGLVLEPQMKVRFPAMVNAITQVCLKPLGDLWYKTLASLKTDCFKDQDAGVQWVKEQLESGEYLAGVDMTSASDLLDLDACIDIVNTVYFNDIQNLESYKEAVKHFKAVSRGLYYSKELGGFVSWKQGQPLGSYPSFALLGLVNNALARLACHTAKVDMSKFRVIGDDMVLVRDAMPYYVYWVGYIGGEINPEKTICSNKLVEFAGRVITADAYTQKATHLREFSDDSFMSYAAAIGPRARRYLLPKQRKLWDVFRYVPGIIVPGPWCRESFGEPLACRYAWFLEQVSKADVIPDLDDSPTVGESLYRMSLREDLTQEYQDNWLPWPISEGAYQAPVGTVIPSGDPRKWKLKGMSLLQVLTKIVSEPTFVDYPTFKAQSTSW